MNVYRDLRLSGEYHTPHGVTQLIEAILFLIDAQCHIAGDVGRSDEAVLLLYDARQQLLEELRGVL